MVASEWFRATATTNQLSLSTKEFVLPSEQHTGAIASKFEPHFRAKQEACNTTPLNGLTSGPMSGCVSAGIRVHSGDPNCSRMSCSSATHSRSHSVRSTDLAAAVRRYFELTIECQSLFFFIRRAFAALLVADQRRARRVSGTQADAQDRAGRQAGRRAVSRTHGRTDSRTFRRHTRGHSAWFQKMN